MFIFTYCLHRSSGTLFNDTTFDSSVEHLNAFLYFFFASVIFLNHLCKGVSIFFVCSGYLSTRQFLFKYIFCQTFCANAILGQLVLSLLMQGNYHSTYDKVVSSKFIALILEVHFLFSSIAHILPYHIISKHPLNKRPTYRPSVLELYNFFYYYFLFLKLIFTDEGPWNLYCSSFAL